MKYYLLLIATALSISACQTAQVVQGPFTKEQIKPMLSAAIDQYGADMMAVTKPVDAQEWCPKFSAMTGAQRKDVFLELGYRMIERESSFKPETKYTESFDDSTGQKVISRGLFQISLESSKGYSCGFKDAEELHDPKRNIDCGVRILNRWISRDNRIGGTVSGAHRGCGRYWSVCRNASSSRPKIVAEVKALPICQ